MNAQQKQAVFCLVGGAAAVTGFLILWPIIGAEAAQGAFGLLGLAGFGGFIRDRQEPDERDSAIAARAMRIGAMASYGAFIMVAMGIWHVRFLWHQQETVTVHAMVWVTVAGIAAFFLVRSVAVLVLYRRPMEARRV